MSVGDYLERADNGENVTVSKMLREGAEEEILEIFDNMERINGLEIQVSREYANEQIYDNTFEDIFDQVTDGLAEGLSSVPRLSNIYDDGFEKADRKMQEIDSKYNGSSKRKQLVKKAKNKDRNMKISEGLLGGGIAGFYLGATSGSQTAMGLSAGSTFLGAVGTPKMKGMKDREVEEAAKGIEKGYGGYQLGINP